LGLAQAAGDEARAAMRAQADKIAVEMDLVRKDELDALKAEISALRAEIAELRDTPRTGTGRRAARSKDAGG
jgi:polyhydroxyalkanoate synthesis regulator phasin